MGDKSSDQAGQPRHQRNFHAGREAIRAKLQAAGILATNLGIPEGIKRVSDEEIARIGHLEPGAKSSDEMLREDRGAY